jgi:hypothetical protein
VIRYLWLEVKRAILSGRFVVGLLLATAAGVLGMVPEIGLAHSAGALYLFRTFYSSSIALLAPILATIPFSQSFAVERNSGFLRSIMQRMPERRYAAARLASTALAGGLVLVIPVAGALAWATASYPIVADPNGDPNVFGRMLIVSPLAFMWIAVGTAFLFGATSAIAGLATSTLFRNLYYANVVPLVLYLVPAFFLGMLGFGFLDPPMMWEPSNHVATTPLSVACQYALWLLASLVVFFRFLRLKEE